VVTGCKNYLARFCGLCEVDVQPDAAQWMQFLVIMRAD